MIQKYIEKITDRKDLIESEASEVLDHIMSGSICELETAAFLAALKTKGEVFEEIKGFLKKMRSRCVPFVKNGYYVDTCGTGGDKKGHINISTISALIACCLGIKIVKHGNRAVSGKCGSADVLEALGIRFDLSPDESFEQLKATSFSFLYAPIYHKALLHASGARRLLGFPTVFNFLGPLSNPAIIDGHVFGVYKKELMTLGSKALMQKDVKKALVVHGFDGSDEISVSSDTYIIELDNGQIKEYIYKPEKKYDDIPKGGDAQYNAMMTKRIFENKISGGLREFVLINAAAAIKVSDLDMDLKTAYEAADEILSGKRVMDKLNDIITFQKRHIKRVNTDA